MKIQWLGHACFLITTSDGTRILTDPYNEEVGYDLPAVEADIVTTSHSHFDHGNVAVVKGKPKVIDSAGDHEIGEVYIHGIETSHDDEAGAKRGKNIVFTIEADDIALCHLGDLGHQLDDDDVDDLGPVDVLLAPVGGFYTIDAKTATGVIDVLEPAIVIPMHVRNDKCALPIDTVDPFLELNKDKPIHRHTESTLEIASGDLPEGVEIHVLSHAL